MGTSDREEAELPFDDVGYDALMISTSPEGRFTAPHSSAISKAAIRPACSAAKRRLPRRHRDEDTGEAGFTAIIQNRMKTALRYIPAMLQPIGGQLRWHHALMQKQTRRQPQRSDHRRKTHPLDTSFASASSFSEWR